MATPERFELPTRCLGRSRSILLSYGVAPRVLSHGARRSGRGGGRRGTGR